MKQKSLSQMNKERQLKPMTKEEEYRNADVPMPEDEFKKVKEAADNEQDYQGGGAYRAFLNLFYKNKRDEDDKK
tara:strand:- start:279 stop:500 length:222 start_codon:yes stop_codon:yes gene_type:complete